jgi:hypothetical protein
MNPGNIQNGDQALRHPVAVTSPCWCIENVAFRLRTPYLVSPQRAGAGEDVQTRGSADSFDCPVLRPLGRRQGGPDELQVAVTRDQVHDAPNIELHGEELSQANESAPYHHFQLNYTPPDIQSGRRLARR